MSHVARLICATCTRECLSILNGNCVDCALQSRSQGLCDTTLTERFMLDECVCGTYPDNLGPCRTFAIGADPERCVYCDHKISCHMAVVDCILMQGE